VSEKSHTHPSSAETSSTTTNDGEDKLSQPLFIALQLSVWGFHFFITEFIEEAVRLT
jgi:hypothetical protein